MNKINTPYDREAIEVGTYNTSCPDGNQHS